HELFATAGDIRVCNNELHITLAPLSSPHRTRAAQALCEMLDQGSGRAAELRPGSHVEYLTASGSASKKETRAPSERRWRAAWA
ncbi:MAG: hypothetical protein WBW73_10900, partial [Rhodoplanes sp.]